MRFRDIGASFIFGGLCGRLYQHCYPKTGLTAIIFGLVLNVFTLIAACWLYGNFKIIRKSQPSARGE